MWVWAVLIRNMLVDRTHSAGFRLVHIGLAVVSLAFAAATLWVASRGRRHPAPDAGTATGPAAGVDAGPAAGVEAGTEHPPVNAHA